MDNRPALIVLDVDGTLVSIDQRVDPEVVRAIAELRSAGVVVCLASGRNLTEMLDVWRQLELAGPFEPIVSNGGALICEPDTQRPLYQQPIEAGLAGEFIDALRSAGRTAALNVDRWRWGADILAVPGPEYDRVRQCWFDRLDALVVRPIERLDSDGLDTPDILRINAVLDQAEAEDFIAPLRQQFADRLTIHAILAPNYGVYFLEAFAIGTDKFSAVRYITQSRRIPASRVVAIGDDINDIPMLTGAGLGLAMPDAPESVRLAAGGVVEPDLAGCLGRLCALPA